MSSLTICAWHYREGLNSEQRVQIKDICAVFFFEDRLKVAFLTLRSASKHIFMLLVSILYAARDTGEGGGSDLVLQAMSFAVSCGLIAVHVSSLHKSSIVKPRN